MTMNQARSKQYERGIEEGEEIERHESVICNRAAVSAGLLCSWAR